MILKSLSKRKSILLVLLPLMIIRPALSAWIGIKAGEFFDLAMYGTNLRRTVLIFVVIFIVWLVNYSLLFYWSRLFKAYLVSRLRLDTKNKMFKSIMSVSAEDFNTMEPGDYIAAFTNDITLLEIRYFVSSLELAEYLITIVVVGGAFFSIDPLLAATVLFFGILGSLISIMLSKYTRRMNDKFIKSFYSFTQVLKELFGSFRTIKNYNITEQTQKRFDAADKNTEDAKYRADFSLEFVNNISSAFSGFLMFAVIGIGMVEVIKGNMSMGIVITAYNFTTELSSPLQYCLHKINEIRSVHTIIDKIKYFDKKAQTETANRITCTTDIKSNELIYDSVSLTLSGNRVLNSFSFRFEPGKKYLIVGKNGAGKSTLFKLLKRTYENYTGSITIGDADILSVPYDELGKLTSYLNEDVHIYSDSVRQNISLFRDIDDKDIQTALKQAQVEIEPERILRDNGSNISSGEKRRIEIARTLASKSPIVIFDEVISTLDIETAYEIENLALTLDSTVIFISHNFSGKLVKKYDAILLMKDGTLIGSGTHDELLNTNEYYRSIWQIKNGDEHKI